MLISRLRLLGSHRNPEQGNAASALTSILLPTAIFLLFPLSLSVQVVSLGRELLGGNGIVADFHVAKAFCDMEAMYTYEGTYDINMLVAGRESTGYSAFKTIPPEMKFAN